MPDTAVVTASAVHKSYGDIAVLKGLDLQIERGEVFALLGPNGAGKTTTIQILSGFRSPTGGTVRVLGEEPWHAGPRWRARIGLVPQRTGSFDELGVGELVAHFATFYPHSRPVDEVLESVGLAGKAKARASTLSGGQQRRLDIALGVVGDPDLVFLDEPTTGLDPSARRQTWNLVEELAASGTTILLTTHYLDEVEALADRVALLDDGRVSEIATPAALGGRARSQTRITFRRGTVLAGVDLPRGLADVAQDVILAPDAAGTVTVSTATPTAALDLLLGWARTHGVAELEELTAARLSLEDIYLRLTGGHPGGPGSTAGPAAGPATGPAGGSDHA